MFIFQFIFVTLGLRYISHNHMRNINIDGARISKILNVYDTIFARTLPSHMVVCIDFQENDSQENYENTNLEIINEFSFKNPTQDVFLGNDMRPVDLDHREILIDKIIELNTKHQLLTTLENKQVSLVTKVTLCDMFNKNKQSYTINLLSGGLTDDFDFDFDRMP